MNCVSMIVAAHGALAIPALATASVITHDMLGQNKDATVLELSDVRIDITAVGGDFKQKQNASGFTGTGIAGGNVSGEIDGNQSMTFAFDKPTIITSLSVSFLFSAGNHGDAWNEIALFTTNLGTYALEATGATTSSWTGFGTSSNISPGAEGGGGVWMLSGDDIFGGAITFLTLSSGNPGDHAMYGDFAFRGMTFAAAVPAPGALALLVGAFVVGGRGRRR